jgi:uncharacterized protein YkwD
MRWSPFAVALLVACDPPTSDSPLPGDGSLNVPPDDPDAGGTLADAGRAMTDGALARDASAVTDRGAAVMDVARAPTSLPDPAARTSAEVCARWRSDRMLRARTTWTAGASQCDLGTLDPTAHDDAMRVLNLYRWLAGVAAVTADASLARAQQECAVMMTANGQLNHSPPTTWRCYTADGARAAGSSNLALGTSTPAASVDLYANETGQNLGHRRWCFAGTLGALWFGSTARASCMQVFRTAARGTPVPVFVAWPNPGPSPIQAFSGVWHVQGGSRQVSGATVEVRNDATGAVLPVTMVATSGNYGNSAALAWRPSGWTPAADTTYRVTLSFASGGTAITYRTTPVRCQ